MESSHRQERTETTGTIVIGAFGASSKSEHTAAFLDLGGTRLRLVLGNPFETAGLVGHMEGLRVRATGRMAGYDTLWLDSVPTILGD